MLELDRTCRFAATDQSSIYFKINSLKSHTHGPIVKSGAALATGGSLLRMRTAKWVPLQKVASRVDRRVRNSCMLVVLRLCFVIVVSQP